jgi:uncharacterized protein (TIGR02145 family)
MKTKFQFISVVTTAILLAFTGCKKNENPPSVTTFEIANITGSSATCGGTITSQGTSAVTARGVCWSKSAHPKITDNKTSDGTSTGDFTSNITGLQPATTYYVRAYATNAEGTGYGTTVTFETLGSTPSVTTLPALFVSCDRVLLKGQVNPNYIDTQVSFDYGETSSYGNEVYFNHNPLSGSENVNLHARIADLSPGRTYHCRIRAVNSLGTSYGNDVTFVANEQVIDIDGNSYNTVTIDNLTWMSRNLETTKFNDGTEIPTEADGSTWAGLVSAAYCWYDNDESSSKGSYGALYNWYAAASGKLCPAGWHVSTDAEWTSLGNYLDSNGYNYDGTSGTNTYALALVAPLGWYWSGNTGAAGNYDVIEMSNITGFSAIPGGVRDANELIFGSRGYYSIFWTSSEYDSGTAWDRGLDYEKKDVGRLAINKAHGLSVRCVKD